MGRYNLCCAIDLLKCTTGSNPTDDCKKNLTEWMR